MACATYADRDRVLAELGFPSYQSYLPSGLWSKIKKACAKRKAAGCCLCSRPAAALHHLDYSADVLAGRDLSKIVPVCNACHLRIEFENPTGRSGKRTLAGTRLVYEEMMKARILLSILATARRNCRSCGAEADKRGRSLFCAACSRKYGPAPLVTA